MSTTSTIYSYALRWRYHSLLIVTIVGTFCLTSYLQTTSPRRDKLELEPQIHQAKKLITNVLLQFVDNNQSACDDFYDFACGSGYPAYLAVLANYKKSKHRYFHSFMRLVGYEMDRIGWAKLLELRDAWKSRSAAASNLTMSEAQLAVLTESCAVAATATSTAAPRVDTSTATSVGGSEARRTVDYVRALFSEAGLHWFGDADEANSSGTDTLLHLAIRFGLTTPIVSLTIRRNQSNVEAKIIEVRSALVRRVSLRELKRDVMMMQASRQRSANAAINAEQKMAAFTHCLRRAKGSRFIER